MLIAREQQYEWVGAVLTGGKVRRFICPKSAAVLALGLIFACVAPRGVHAQWVPGGNRISSASVGSSLSQPFDAISDGANGMIVVWNGGAQSQLYAQRVDGSGRVVHGWPTDGVPVGPPTSQFRYAPTAASDGIGGAYISWEDQASFSERTIALQHVSQSGVPMWTTPITVASTSETVYWIPTWTVSDGAGGVIVAWARGTYAEAGWDLVAQRFDANGEALWAPGGVTLSAAPQNQVGLAFVTDGSGGLLGFWSDFRTPQSALYGQHILSDGTRAPNMPEDGMRLGPNEYVQMGEAAPDNAGGAFIAWTGYRNGNADVFVLHFEGSGTAPDWPAEGKAVCETSGDQYSASLATDGADGVYVSWSDYRNGANHASVSMKHFGPSAEPFPGFPTDGLTLPQDFLPTTSWPPGHGLVRDGDSGVFACWTTPQGVFVQRFNANGDVHQGWRPKGTPLCLVAPGATLAAIVPDALGGALLAWPSREGGMLASSVNASGSNFDYAPNASWQLSAGGGPSNRSGHAMVFDPYIGTTFVLGGTDGTHPLADSWSLDWAWHPLSPMGSMPARTNHVAVSNGAEEVVFGGDGANGRLNDVWKLYGTSFTIGIWSQLLPTGSPPSPRTMSAAAFDAMRNCMVVFGGFDGTRLNDVWVLSLDVSAGPIAWTKLTPLGVPPSARIGASAIYDRDRDRIIVFGGNDGTARNDTWALTLGGSPTWTKLDVSSPPPARFVHAAVYDPYRDRMIVYGGKAITSHGDAWALSLSGTLAWSAITMAGIQPASRASAGAVFDAGHDEMLVFGGEAGTPLSDLWTLKFSQAAVPTPGGLGASMDACGEAIHLTWNMPTGQASTVQIWSKVATQGDQSYVLLGSVPGTTTSYSHQPTDGVAHCYKVRAMNGDATSAFSGTATAEAPGAAIGLPSKLTVKSIGDAHGLRVRIWPPIGTTSWAGVRSIQIEQASDPDFTQVTSVMGGPPSGTGPQLYDFTGLEGQPYYFRAHFVNQCGTAGNLISDVSGVRPVHAPILMLHGINGAPSQWAEHWNDAFAAHGMDRYERYAFSCHVMPWELEAEELSLAISTRLHGVWVTDEAVDIVAHSQGGLAARSYIEEIMRGAATAKVRKLFMLGTPHHGADLTTLYGIGGTAVINALRGNNFYCYPPYKSAADLRGASPRLAQLNFEDPTQHDGECQQVPLEHIRQRTGDVAYYTLAGTAGSSLACEHHPLLCIRAAAKRPSMCTNISDGFVPLQSAHLRELPYASPACAQWLDIDVPSATKVGHNDLIEGSPAIADFVAGRLAGEPLPVGTGALGCALESSAGSEPSRSHSEFLSNATAQDTVVLSPALLDSVFSGDTLRVPIDADAMSGLFVFVAWLGELPEISIETPDGVVFTASDTTKVPWLHYDASTVDGYSGFLIDSPQSGRWTLLVRGGGHASKTLVVVESMGCGSSFAVDASLNSAISDPGDTVSVHASMLRNGFPVAATLTAELLDAIGGVHSVQLSDGGANGDSTGGDHVYSGRFIAPSVDGTAVVRVVGAADVGSFSVTRGTRHEFEIASRPNIEVSTRIPVCTPDVPILGQVATIQASVRNRGLAEAAVVAWAITDGATGDTVGSGTALSLAAGDSVALATSWSPLASGEHDLLLRAWTVGVAEGDQSDNAVAILVSVSQPPIGSGTSVQPDVPRSLELRSPRPNPLRGSTRIEFGLPRQSRVTLDVFDIMGRRVRTLVDADLESGWHGVTWDRRDASADLLHSGVFFIHINALGRSVVRRVVLLR